MNFKNSLILFFAIVGIVSGIMSILPLRQHKEETKEIPVVISTPYEFIVRLRYAPAAIHHVNMGLTVTAKSEIKATNQIKGIMLDLSPEAVTSYKISNINQLNKNLYSFALQTEQMSRAIVSKNINITVTAKDNKDAIQKLNEIIANSNQDAVFIDFDILSMKRGK